VGRLVEVSSPPHGSQAPPVALFVYRRHHELERTLQCLRDCGVQSLHVFSDGAADPEAARDVELVRDRLAGIDWIDAKLVEHPVNLGLSRSIRSGLDGLFREHETVVVIEDDVCVAPEFYDYARSALAHYREEPHVAGVTGLRYPFDPRPLQRYEFDVFHSPRFSSWAWATWRDRWQGFEFDLAVLRERIAASPGFDPARAGADMPGMIVAAVLDETLGGSWDVVCAANMLLQGTSFVTPTWNMVENSGLEHGTHADGAPAWELSWETRPPQWPPAPLRFASVGYDESVLAAYRRFFAGDLGGGPLRRTGGSIARWREARRLRSRFG
jgi:hypothetical protein